MRPIDEWVISLRSDGLTYVGRCWRNGELMETEPFATGAAALDMVWQLIRAHDAKPRVMHSEVP